MRKTTTDTVELMREITWLFSRSHRILVHYCNATGTQAHVLLELEHRGPRSLGELGASLELGKSWTGRVVKKLLAAGAVTRRSDPRDRRRRIVELTALGRHRVMYLRSELDHYAARLHDCRPESERRRLNDELRGLVAALGKNDDTRARAAIPGQLCYPVWSGFVRGDPPLI